MNRTESVVRNLTEFLKGNVFHDFLSDPYQNYMKWNNHYKTTKMLDSNELIIRLKRTHLLMIVATGIELSAMHFWFANKNNEIIRIIDKGIVYHFVDLEHYNIVYICAGETGSHTRQGSATTLSKVFDIFIPQLVISVGIAFGSDSDNQNIGEVLISDKVFSYDEGTKRTDFTIENTKHTPDLAFHFKIKNLQVFSVGDDLKERLRYKVNTCKSNDLKMHFGNIVTGGGVVESESFLENIICELKYRGVDVIGGEMEGWGVFFECEKKDVPCAIIKSICDWGIAKNSLETIIKDNPDLIAQKHLQLLINDSFGSSEINDKVKDCIQTFAALKSILALNILLDDEKLLRNIVQSDRSISTIRRQDKLINFYMSIVDKIHGLDFVFEIFLVSLPLIALLLGLIGINIPTSFEDVFQFALINKAWAVAVCLIAILVLVFRGAVLSRVMKWLRHHSSANPSVYFVNKRTLRKTRRVVDHVANSVSDIVN